MVIREIKDNELSELLELYTHLHESINVIGRYSTDRC